MTTSELIIESRKQRDWNHKVVITGLFQLKICFLRLRGKQIACAYGGRW